VLAAVKASLARCVHGYGDLVCTLLDE